MRVIVGHELSGERISVVNHWRIGLLYGYPRCCVARFCFDQALGRKDCALRRGGDTYVPCGVFHHGDPVATT